MQIRKAIEAISRHVAEAVWNHLEDDKDGSGNVNAFPTTSADWIANSSGGAATQWLKDAMTQGVEAYLNPSTQTGHAVGSATSQAARSSFRTPSAYSGSSGEFQVEAFSGWALHAMRKHLHTDALNASGNLRLPPADVINWLKNPGSVTTPKIVMEWVQDATDELVW